MVIILAFYFAIKPHRLLEYFKKGGIFTMLKAWNHGTRP